MIALNYDDEYWSWNMSKTVMNEDYDARQDENDN